MTLKDGLNWLIIVMHNCGVRHIGNCDAISLSRFGLLLVRTIMHMFCIASQALLLRVPAYTGARS